MRGEVDDAHLTSHDLSRIVVLKKTPNKQYPLKHFEDKMTKLEEAPKNKSLRCSTLRIVCSLCF